MTNSMKMVTRQQLKDQYKLSNRQAVKVLETMRTQQVSLGKALVLLSSSDSFDQAPREGAENRRPK